MRTQEQDMGQVRHADEVWVRRARLQHMNEAKRSVHLDEAGKSDHRVHTDVELQEIQRQYAQQICIEEPGVDVSLSQFLGVVHH